MKILSAFVMVLVLAKGCNSSELRKESENISFEYEATTRGNYRKIIAGQDTIFTIKSRNGEAVEKNFHGDWNSMLDLLAKVDRANIQNLKAPSEKRFYDGAMIAGLTVIYKQDTYRSASFDHGNPPKEIKKLVEKIISASDLNKE
ncbi:hypothetical protein H9W95_02760 [Flavobacterium lindanitolerans]|nr:hypothetical protein [Flavobacterium lindanitolerans]